MRCLLNAIFFLFEDNRKYRTSVFDFEHKRIDFHRYRVFQEYLDRYKFHGNNTVVYLCTREDTTSSVHNAVGETLSKITMAKENDIILIELKEID